MVRQEDEHVRHHAARVGSFAAGVADHLDQSAGDHHERQIGRRIGEDIVQIGNRPDGTPTRWTFSEITANSFHWTGEALNPDGHTWRLEGDFRVTRMH